jgi:polyferredoxin
MQISRTIKRTIASAILATGLAYPACAAVCPKGIGGCTAPGRCFLFVDADGNSLCDYTARTGSSAPTGSFPSQPGTASPAAPVQAPATPVPDPASVSPAALSTPATQANQLVPSQETTSSAIQSTVPAAATQGIPLSAIITVAALFFLFTIFIFALVRTGITGVRIEKPLPALALSSLFGLGLSLMATTVITGGAIAGMTCALIFMGAGTLLATYLWHTGVMTRKTVLIATAISTLAGFVFLAPIMPGELGGFVNVITGVSVITIGIIGIGAVVALTLVTGRIFCGTLCPVGSVQELAYAVPGKKIPLKRTQAFELVHLGFFVATVAAAIRLIDLMAFTGLYDLFSLTLSAGFVVAVIILLISAFVYRPVCRILCPFGVLFSILAEFSLFRLRRTDACISCQKCEKVCPSGSAGKDGSKRECYLCSRCTEACPKEMALRYQK